jgi:hypothetical protein
MIRTCRETDVPLAVLVLDVGPPERCPGERDERTQLLPQASGPPGWTAACGCKTCSMCSTVSTTAPTLNGRGST